MREHYFERKRGAEVERGSSLETQVPAKYIKIVLTFLSLDACLYGFLLSVAVSIACIADGASANSILL